MMVYDNSKSRSFVNLCPRTLRFNIFKLLVLKINTGPFEAKIHVEPSWDVWMKIYSNVPGHICPRWRPGPYMVKTFKNHLLRYQEPDDLETWYTASGTLVQPNMFK